MPASHYKTDYPSITEMLDEIIASGRGLSEACSDLISAIRDSALLLFDGHEDPLPPDRLTTQAIEMLEAYRQNRQLSYGTPTYFKRGVVAWRVQFERVFQIAAANGRESAPSIIAERPEGETAKLGRKGIEEFVRAYVKSTDQPSIHEIETLAKAAGLKGHREDLRATYRACLAMNGISNKQGRRRLN